MRLYEHTENASTKCVLRCKRRSTAENRLPTVPGKEMWGVFVNLLVYHSPPNSFQFLLCYAASQCSANAAMQLTQTSPCRKEHSWFSSWTASTQRLPRASACCAVDVSWLPSVRSVRSAPTVQSSKVSAVDVIFRCWSLNSAQCSWMMLFLSLNFSWTLHISDLDHNECQARQRQSWRSPCTSTHRGSSLQVSLAHSDLKGFGTWKK